MNEENLPEPQPADTPEAYVSPFEDLLTPKENLFAHQYAIDLNPQRAAEACGITIREANKLRKMEQVRKCVADLHSKVLAKCGYTLERTLAEVGRIGFFNIKNIVKNVNECGVEWEDWEDIDGRAIAEVQQKHTKEGHTYALIKTHRKLDALKILLEYFKDTPAEQHLHIHTDEVKARDPEKAQEFFNSLLDGT